MAKAVKFIKRKRNIAGRANGVIVCSVSFPAIEEKYYQRFGFRKNETKLLSFGRFFRKELSRASTILEGATVTADAVVRMKSGRLGRKRLGAWQSGDSVQRFVNAVTKAWVELPKEDDWESEVIDLPDTQARSRLRR